METIEAWLLETRKKGGSPDRPQVTLSYAQSLDGSLSAALGQRTGLSGPESLPMTHRLRALHDGVLVGIGTVLADDPRLTVRLAEGPDPQPVVVDTHLRIAMDSALLKNKSRPPWLVCAAGADEQKALALREAGARLIPCPQLPGGGLDLAAALRCLKQNGLNSLMVEGGARIIVSVLAAGLADLAVITISPVWLRGLQLAPDLAGHPDLRPSLADPLYQQMGRDLVVWGRIEERKI